MDRLLRAGAGIGVKGWRGCHGRTLLDAAAEGGNDLVVSALLYSGGRSEINEKTTRKKRTALHRAAHGGHRDAARTLLAAGADVNIIDRDRSSPLRLAIEHGHNEHLAGDLLLTSEYKDIKDVNGHFPIHLAASRGLDQTVKLLLLKGVNVNSRSDTGDTPLHYAIEENHYSTMELLLAAGADLGAFNNAGHTPLHHAITQNSNLGIVEALLEKGTDIDIKDRGGSRPLHIAANKGNEKVMAILLRMGADVDATNSKQETPLHHACSTGWPGAADLLLRWGADETLRSACGRPPSAFIPRIHLALEADRPRLERLERLLQRAPQDRAWRRRGLFLLCRAYPEKLGIGTELLEASHGSPSEALDRTGVKAANKMKEGSVGGRREDDFESVAAWMLGLKEEDVFRHVVGYL